MIHASNEMCCRPPPPLLHGTGSCSHANRRSCHVAAVLLLYAGHECHLWFEFHAIGRLKEADFEKIADFLHETLELCKRTQEKHGKLLKDFNKWVAMPLPNPKTQCSGGVMYAV